MSWEGHLDSEKKKNACNVLVRKSKGKCRLEVFDVDGKIILKWIWRKLDGSCGLNLPDLG
jgi:hypothetical protein